MIVIPFEVEKIKLSTMCFIFPWRLQVDYCLA